ncbi:hypothetical protein [Brevibacillus sp. H7]|uniref:hypothetical protein n=1 Tax=Brevibacillus sp. H7 TaxID=3349138 RepID=UPI0038016765
MSAFKLDPDWVVTYLDHLENKLAYEVNQEQKEEIMSKIREMTLSIMYKQAKKFIEFP